MSLTFRVAWYADPSAHVRVDQLLAWAVIVSQLTLGVVADFPIDGLRRERDLMGEYATRRGGPIGDQAVVAGNPLRGDISVDLHAVRVAIV